MLHQNSKILPVMSSLGQPLEAALKRAKGYLNFCESSPNWCLNPSITFTSQVSDSFPLRRTKGDLNSERDECNIKGCDPQERGSYGKWRFGQQQ
ncbi:hypothetical protein SLA2020_360340 [Shorea laevis]